ncbi:MAG: DUF308 domain-containing protein [Erysipelotrichales bacterium]|nr:DUF308 domain-containing protein [Erysipelotrichales bacterium]
MLRKKIHVSTLVLTGLYNIVLGLLSIRRPIPFITILYYSLSIGLPILGLYQMVSAYFSKNVKRYKYASIIDGLAIFIAGIVVYRHPRDVLSITPLVLGIYGILKALICFFNFYVYYTDRLKGQLFILLEAIIYFIISLLLIINPIYPASLVLYVLGIYFITYGIVQLGNAFQALFPNRRKHKIKMTMPIFMNFLMPQKLVYYINRVLNEQGAKSEVLTSYKENQSYDMEILIHLGVQGFDSVGHVDVAFGNIVISYGCHDHHNTKFGGALGDGVIHFNEKSKYLNFVINERNKQLIGFGISLTESQKRKIKKTLLDMASRFEDWNTDYDKREMGLPYLGECRNYASLLSKFCRTKFFKFTSGQFKTYFIMTTNCVLLVDTLLGKSGVDLLKINGIVTPGAYCEFLNNEFSLAHSNVVSRRVYTASDVVITEDPMVDVIHDMHSPLDFINDYIFKDVDI